MRMRAIFAAISILAITVAGPAPGSAKETDAVTYLLAQAAGLPKGSYQQSCQCQLSGGVTLLCFCNNLQGRMFQTTMDVRNCTLPKDIKNCNGNLKCIEKGQECQ
jgi:hypothetical protein